MKHIGAHVSAGGGVENAPVNAGEIGANAFALFTKNQRQWNSPPLTAKSIAAFKANCEKLGFLSTWVIRRRSLWQNPGRLFWMKCNVANNLG
jgi:deoxyribonuclease-4